MSQIPAVCTALKRLLRERHLTYRDLAGRLGMSEANVKRMFARQSITLERLEAICAILDLGLAELFAIVDSNERSLTQLTHAFPSRNASTPVSCWPCAPGS